VITQEEVEHLAKLARLGLTEKEMEKIQKELSLILDYFKILKEIDTENVAPTSHPVLTEPGSEISLLLGKSYLRKDEVFKSPSEQTEKLIKMAPQKEKGYLKVKSIL